MNLKDFKKELLLDKKTRESYENRNLAMQVSGILFEARIKLGITQNRLAELAGTRQPSIARAENGTYLPSLSFLEKIAASLDTRLIINFEFLQNNITEMNQFNEAPDVTKKITLGSRFYPSFVDVSYSNSGVAI